VIGTTLLSSSNSSDLTPQPRQTTTCMTAPEYIYQDGKKGYVLSSLQPYPFLLISQRGT
jgi:hypothetical protein